MSYMETLKKINKKNLAPVYFLYGTEAYFIENIKDKLIDTAADNQEDSLSVYDLEEIPIEDVINDAETYPFFSDRKIVIANNPVFLKPKPEKLPFEHDISALERYIKAPADYSILIIIAPYEKIDERKRISKLLKKETTAVECNAMKDNDLRQWMNEIAKNLDITITDDAFEILESELTTNMHQLENEINKMAIYAGPGGEITKEIAEDLVSHTVNSSSLRLVDAVMEKDLHKAMVIYKDLEKMKEEPIALIALIAFQFRSILRVKLLKKQGYSQYQIQKQLGVHPYVVKIALDRERRFAQERLQEIIIQLTEADAAIKQGKMDKGLVFELLLYQLIEAA